MNTEPDFDDKLEAIVRQLNTEAIARAGADATITNRLNSVQKVMGDLEADLTVKIGATADTVHRLAAEVRSLQEAQSVAALALEVATMRETLSQLLSALSEEFDEEDDFRQAMDGDGNLMWPLSEDDQ